MGDRQREREGARERQGVREREIAKGREGRGVGEGCRARGTPRHIEREIDSERERAGA